MHIPWYIKFWAFIYRRTGFVHGSVELFEYNYLLNNMERIGKVHEKELEDPEGFTLEEIMGMEIGSFQGQIGLTVSHSHMIWPGDTFKDKVVKVVKRLIGV